MRIEKEPAYILHVRPHLDKTRLVAALTADHGWLRLVARLSTRFMGVPIEPFMPVRLSWRRSDRLPGIRGYEVVARSHLRAAQSQMLGIYLNELIMKLVATDVPCPDLFHAYEQSLVRIAQTPDDEWTLRRFEVMVLEAAGHGLNLVNDTAGHAIEDDAYYVYNPEDGAIETAASDDAIGGKVFRLLRGDDEASDDATLTRSAKKFMRFMIDYHLQGKEIRTRGLFKYLEA